MEDQKQQVVDQLMADVPEEMTKAEFDKILAEKTAEAKKIEDQNLKEDMSRYSDQVRRLRKKVHQFSSNEKTDKIVELTIRNTEQMAIIERLLAQLKETNENK